MSGFFFFFFLAEIYRYLASQEMESCYDFVFDVRRPECPLFYSGIGTGSHQGCMPRRVFAPDLVPSPISTRCCTNNSL